MRVLLLSGLEVAHPSGVLDFRGRASRRWAAVGHVPFLAITNWWSFRKR